MTFRELLEKELGGDDPIKKQLLQNSLYMMRHPRVFGGTVQSLPKKTLNAPNTTGEDPLSLSEEKEGQPSTGQGPATGNSPD